MRAPEAENTAWVVPDWPAPSSVHTAVSTRLGPGVSAPPFERFNLGMSNGDAVEDVLMNREALGLELQLPSPPRWLRQVHGCDVLELGPRAPAPLPRADAAVSRAAGTVLAILTADCLPVLLASDDGRCIAAAHAGWRGLAAGVLEATVEAIPRPPAEVLAWLGPCVGAPSYEVGDEVRDAFVCADERATEAFAATRPGHWRCALEMLARQRLRAVGVERMYGGGFDTMTDARFYSRRRDGDGAGRFASLIWLQPDWTHHQAREAP